MTSSRARIWKYVHWAAEAALLLAHLIALAHHFGIL